MPTRKAIAAALYGLLVVPALAFTIWLWGGLPGLVACAAMIAFGAVIFILARRGRSRKRDVPRPVIANPARIAGTPAELSDRLVAVEHGMAIVARRLIDLENRVSTIDAEARENHASAIGAVSDELEAVGGVIRELAEAVALHDAELFAAPRDRSQPEWVSVEAAMPQAAQDVPVSHPAPRPPAQGSTAPGAMASVPETPPPVAHRLAEPLPLRPAAPPAGLREAILQGRIELLLQVVAGLPGRKVRMYELLGQMADGEDVVSSDRVMAGAESLGLGARHGRFMLGHALKIARHLMSRNRKVPVICPTSFATLADPGVVKELSTLIAADRELSGRILFKMSQRDLRDIGPIERDALDAIRDLGFRFVMDTVLDLRFDPRRLAEQGVEFVKVQMALLTSALDGSVATEIHPHDFSGLFARHGITLVVSEVDAERVALELQDYSATLAQGAAFGEPRPVRLDVIEAAAQVAAVAPPPAPEPPEPAPRAEPAPPSYVPFRSHLRRSGT